MIYYSLYVLRNRRNCCVKYNLHTTVPTFALSNENIYSCLVTKCYQARNTIEDELFFPRLDFFFRDRREEGQLSAERSEARQSF